MALTERTCIYDNSENNEPTECTVKGKIPAWLSGDFIRNGPGEVTIGDESFKHWFDGHAIINKFSVTSDGRVFYSSRFIQSQMYKINHKHKRIISSAFDKSIPDPCKNVFSKFFTKYFSMPIHDNTNVNIAKLGDTFYATTDSGIMYEFDRNTLENKNTPYSATAACGTALLTAHPHYDKNGDYYNIGSLYGKQSMYTVLKVKSEDMTGPNPMQHLKQIAQIPADDTWNPSYFHSFALTRNYVVLHEQNLRMSIKQLLIPGKLWEGGKGIFKEVEDKETMFHVISKETGKEVPVKFITESRFCFHHINAFEDKIGNCDVIVMDMMCSKKSFFSDLTLKEMQAQVFSKIEDPKSQVTPHRYILPLNINEQTLKGVNLINYPGYTSTAVLRDDGTIYLEADILIPDQYISKFPTTELPGINYDFNGRKYRYVYSAATGTVLMSSLIKFDVFTREVLSWNYKNHFVSEPVFVRRPDATDEDDGVVISVVIHTIEKKSAFLLVLDAASFTEIARAEITAQPPIGFHGIFTT